MQPVREAVSYRGLFTVDWFSVREKHYSRLKIYDHLLANEQAVKSPKHVPRPSDILSPSSNRKGPRFPKR